MKTLALLLMMITLSIPMGGSAQAQTVTSTDLIENARALDGQTILFTGEVIGDIMKRGDHTWINVSDGSNAMGVWAENDQVKEIAVTGLYGTHGDTVQVTGVFHRACREHGGDMDIHATQIAVKSAGYPVPKTVTVWRLVLALGLTAAAAVVGTSLLVKRWRR